MSDIVITYETLFEFLRKEKSQDEIQELPKSFFSDVVTYLDSKRDQLSENKLGSFLDAGRGRKESQADNAVRIIREIYDRRERKILMIAMNRARTESNIIDTSNLLSEEKVMYDKLVTELTKYRKGILNCVLLGTGPEICMQETYSDKEKPPKEAPIAQSPKVEKPIKAVKILKSVPKFVGKEMETYGPFEENDTATLPNEIADLLVRKGRAEVV